MIMNYDYDYENKNKIRHSSNWPYIADHPYRMYRRFWIRKNKHI